MKFDPEMPIARSSSEERYIYYRRFIAFLNSCCFKVCRIFPIKNNLISVCTFEGRGGFGCNPKYIVQELHKINQDSEFVWFVNSDIYDQKEFPDYIRKVKNTFWNRAYWLTISKVWIDNYRKPYGTLKRKGQVYINTWHATIGFKNVGKWRGSSFSKMAYLVSKNDSDMIDKMIIDSKWCEEAYPKGLIYDGEYLRVGAPRCDILYGDRTVVKEQFRKKHNLPENANVVMFAPTFREKSKDGKRSVFSEVWSIDFVRMLDNLATRFGGEWYLCIRVHPQLAATEGEYANSRLEGRVIDASKEDDMNEILAAMDAFVTDYSSAAMDASCCHMPVFLYADDLDDYINDRGGMLWNITSESCEIITNNKAITPSINAILPYSISQNNDELEYNILNFNAEKYERCLTEYEHAVELVFDGKASENTAKFLNSYIKNSGIDSQ